MSQENIGATKDSTPSEEHGGRVSIRSSNAKERKQRRPHGATKNHKNMSLQQMMRESIAIQREHVLATYKCHLYDEKRIRSSAH